MEVPKLRFGELSGRWG